MTDLITIWTIIFCGISFSYIVTYGWLCDAIEGKMPLTAVIHPLRRLPHSWLSGFLLYGFYLEGFE